MTEIDEEEQLGTDEIILDDVQAEETILKIQEIEAERDRLIGVCQKMIDRYTSQITMYRESSAEKTMWYYGRLKDFFYGADKRRELKTKAVYRLPSGKITLKYGHRKIEHNDKDLLEWVKTNGFDEYVKKKEVEVVDWTGIKDKLAFVEGNALMTGEYEGMVVDGVHAVDIPDEFEFKLYE